MKDDTQNGGQHQPNHNIEIIASATTTDLSTTISNKQIVELYSDHTNERLKLN